MDNRNRKEYQYKRPRKKYPFLLLLILLAAAAFLIHFRVVPLEQDVLSDKSLSQKSSSAGLETGTIPEETAETLQAMAAQNPKAGPILQNPGRYPERLLESLARNPELLDFTLDYPEKKGTSAKNIDLSGKDRQGRIPLLMQWDEDWGYASYGDGIIALDGCGPTCLSMVAVGLTGDSALNPKAVAEFSEKNGYLDATGSTLWTLMSKGAKDLGLSSREIPLDESLMAQELAKGHPIICSLRPGDFTTVGHFIVLYGYENGNFLVNDPNSKSRSEQAWSYGTLKPQIRNLWAFST
ncbi:C39 family peptidase [Caproiciproducens sp. R1]|uniref:C39 family peptidase n=1 Tax=Caproiciproducens sp. R1 TaxID=3435000 RepID=UPI004033CA3C